jgi:hypothetical protein
MTLIQFLRKPGNCAGNDNSIFSSVKKLRWVSHGILKEKMLEAEEIY